MRVARAAGDPMLGDGLVAQQVAHLEERLQGPRISQGLRPLRFDQAHSAVLLDQEVDFGAVDVAPEEDLGCGACRRPRPQDLPEDEGLPDRSC